jgi:hypothetical protein
VKAELTDQLEVVRYTVFAEMAWLDRRPELSMICVLARDAGGRISSGLVQQALPGLAEAGAANLIRYCAELGLTDEHGSLTTLGELAADTGEAPVPEQGVYEFWVVSDSLLGDRILHAERISTDRDRNVRDLAPLRITPGFGTPFVSVVEPHLKYVLRSFPGLGEAGAYERHTNARCQVLLNLDWDQELCSVRISGAVDVLGEDRPVQHTPEHVEIDLWALADGWGPGPLRRHGTWSTGSRQLMVEPAGLTPVEQDEFRKDLDLGTVTVPGLGDWDGVRLTQTPIGPVSGQAAGQWAMMRLDRRLGGDEVRRTRTAVRALFADLTEQTPLAALEPVLPGHEHLLARYAKRPDMFWRLAAPVDLSLVPVSPAEFGPMRVSEEAPAEQLAPARAGAVVRVPYPGGWSMRMLADQLIRPHSVRELLLVDPFRGGPGDLVSLEVLAAALAELAHLDLFPFDVCTGDDVDGDTAAAIVDITERQALRYSKVFDKSGQPHDSYLVVVPKAGPPFGWQFTGSPLSARVPDGADASPYTPLHWHDLTAVRLSAGQLRPSLTAWIRGELK